MDIEGFVRRKIKDKDENTVQKTLTDKILEYKDIDHKIKPINGRSCY